MTRTLVAAHSEEGTEPANWFKERIPGDVARRAKMRCAEALAAGEVVEDLMSFTDLGDLIAIVTNSGNCPLFSMLFVSKDSFRVVIQRLNAWRRPVMHGRPVDAVQLGELIFTVHRLMAAVRTPSFWDASWDEEA